MKKGNKSDGNKHDKDNDNSNSYSTIRRRKGRKKLLIFVIPISVMIITFGIYIAMQAREQGFGTTMVSHIHPNLTLIVDGISSSVPENIGIDTSLYKDHSLDKYGMSGMAPIHTHDSSGVIHVESNTNRNYTFDEFLDIWGLNLNDKTIQVSANGKPVNDLSYVLKDSDDIIMDVKQQ